MIKVFVASNEQRPYTRSELGMATAPYPTKAVSGVQQCGDYYAEKDGHVIPIVFERKSLMDAYGSFVIEKNRARLYMEIERYHLDDRFSRFVIVIEATHQQYKSFFPWAVTKWHQQNGDLPRFFATVRKKKETVLTHLRERGAEICFAGDRGRAARYIASEVQIWGNRW